MKFLFMTILLLGVGIGVAGCEDDDDSAQEQAVAEETVETGDGGEQEYDLEFYGMVFPNGEAGPAGGNGGAAVQEEELDFFIRGEDGVYYYPGDTLPESFRKVGLEVWVLARKVGEIHPRSILIHIVEIRQR